MGYNTELEVKDGWLSVRTTGRIESFALFAEKAALVIGKIKETGVKRVLLDDRGLALNLEAFDVSRVADRLEQADLDIRELRIASLCNEEDRQVYRMIETVYRNRSISFQLFEEREGALAWLLS